MRRFADVRHGLAGGALFLALAAVPIACEAATSRGLDEGLTKVDGGTLKGRLAKEVWSFKGVPYAQPPVGDLRWRAPQPPKAWTGVREAADPGPLCMQKIVPDNGVGAGPASEDCLTLNVFAPAGAADRRLPVMVWIHGGGFINGSGGAALYDGTQLARQGVVVVTLNYRLGRFGFFAHPALTAETPEGPLANYGLLDQVAALTWVQRNIAQFGGDPRNVTLFGESAGGMSVNRLMAMESAQGLFHKAIIASGLGREHGQNLKAAEASGEAFAARLGLKGASAAQLRAVPAADIQAAGDLNLFAGEAPILDGKVVRQGPLTAFTEGAVAPIPMIIGSNDLELPAASAGLLLEKLIGVPEARKAAAIAGYGSPAAYAEHIATDLVFAEPARTLAKAHVGRGAPTYLYRFSVVSAKAPTGMSGAVHGADRQYVFQTLAASPWPTDERDAALAKTISAYWVSFAKTGDPNGPSRPRWPRYGDGDQLIAFTNAGPRAMATPNAAPLDALAASYLATPTSEPGR